MDYWWDFVIFSLKIVFIFILPEAKTWARRAGGTENICRAQNM